MSEHQEPEASTTVDGPALLPEGDAEEQTAPMTPEEEGNEVEKRLKILDGRPMELYAAIHTELSLLEKDLKRTEEPTWQEQLAEVLLDAAVSAATAGMAEMFTGLLFKSHGADGAAAAVGHQKTPRGGTRHKTSAAKPASHSNGEHASAAKSASHSNGEHASHVLKEMFTMGLDEGLKGGVDKLREPRSEGEAKEHFILAHLKAQWFTQVSNGDKFQLGGRGTIRSLEVADALVRACAPERMLEVAHQQYLATRDAWASFLSQGRFGDKGDGTTDMRGQEARDRANKSAPGWVPAEAPTFKAAIAGEADGVLACFVDLPATDGKTMNGTPAVKIAYMNGLPDVIRDQYAEQPLSECRVARQILAKVHGAPDFTVSIDENGLAYSPPHKSSTWLRLRATVGHPENEGQEDYYKGIIGLQLLLAELVPGKVANKQW